MNAKDFHDKVEAISFEGLTVASSVLDLVIEVAQDAQAKLKERARGVDSEKPVE